LNDLEKVLTPLGITPSIFSILVTIRRKGKKAEITVNKIMEEALMTSGGMSNLLKKTIESGLITKRKGVGDEDSRLTFVKLTPKGILLIDKAMEIQAAMERKFTQKLTTTENKQLSKLLKKMLDEE
jgi:DNA-binding MarR family transcriptional regulator